MNYRQSLKDRVDKTIWLEVWVIVVLNHGVRSGNGRYELVCEEFRNTSDVSYTFIFWRFYFHTEMLKMWVYCKTGGDTSCTFRTIDVKECGSLMPQIFLFTFHFTPYRATLIKSTCWKSRVATSVFSVGCHLAKPTCRTHATVNSCMKWLNRKE